MQGPHVIRWEIKYSVLSDFLERTSQVGITVSRYRPFGVRHSLQRPNPTMCSTNKHPVKAMARRTRGLKRSIQFCMYVQLRTVLYSMNLTVNGRGCLRVGIFLFLEDLCSITIPAPGAELKSRLVQEICLNLMEPVPGHHSVLSSPQIPTIPREMLESRGSHTSRRLHHSQSMPEPLLDR